MYKLNENTPLNPTRLMSYIEDFVMNEQPRLVKLKRYYKADNPGIMDAPVDDPLRPNYKIAHSFASYISDTHIGYFMGSPITYASEDERALEQLKLINEFNDEQSQNLRLERDASIYGIAYELQYVSKGKVHYKDIDPRHAFVIYDDSLEENILYFVRMYQAGLGDDNWYIELYDSKNRYLYEVVGNSVLGTLKPIKSTLHGYQEVPVAVYANNRDRIGDFERVIGMIDAYDSIASNTINDLENFADAYLVFNNVDIPGDTPEEQQEQIAQMRKNKVIQHFGEGEVSWLTKDVADAGAWEGSQAKLEEQIYYMTGTPNYNDESFAGNSSGVAMKYKLQPLEQKASTKEREFRVGLQRRVELMAQVIDLLGGSFSYLDIEMNFKRTLPIDLLYEMQFLQAGEGLVSKETLLSQISFIDNPSEELESLQEENDTRINFNFNGHWEEKEDETTQDNKQLLEGENAS